jgi:hypothetical protein
MKSRPPWHARARRTAARRRMSSWARRPPVGTSSLQHAAMTTIDEMLHLDLLTPHQHELIAAWIARVKTPDAILQMPTHLWQALEQASERMNVDADLRQLPPFAA